MSTVRRFEDLDCWQSARLLVKHVYQISQQGKFSKDFGLRDQIQRAAISVMSNIAEGFHAGSNAEFLRFLGYSRRSVAEMQSQLYTALDLSYISQEAFDEIFSLSEKTFRQINAFISYLRRYKNKRVAEDPADYNNEYIKSN